MKQHKRIGILGGMSPEATILYYNQLIKKYYQKYQDYFYPEIIIFSVNLGRIIDLQERGLKKEYVEELLRIIDALKKAGADFVIISANTPHMVFDELQSKAKVPMLSIVECTAEKAKSMQVKKALLLGTKFTMQKDFFPKIFQKKEIEVITPTIEEQMVIHGIIEKELARGIVRKESRQKLLDIIGRYDVDAVILGCTELPLILTKQDTDKILLDTVDIHTDAVLEFAFS
jgi:aspartate racemase